MEVIDMLLRNDMRMCGA